MSILRYRQFIGKMMTALLLASLVWPMGAAGVSAAGTLPQYWSSFAIKCAAAACPSLANSDANYANAMISVRTSNGKLQNEGDTMYAAYTSMTGDFTVTARVKSFKNQPANASDTAGGGSLSYQNKAMLFIKKSIDASNADASSISPSLSLIFQPKQATELSGSNLKNSNYVYAWQNHVTSATTANNVATAVSETKQLAGYPIAQSDLADKAVYFKLVKSTDPVSKNSTYAAYISNDGVNYGNGTTSGTALYSYTDTNNAVFGTGSVFIGLGVDYGTVDFSDVKIVDAFGNTVFPNSLSSATPVGLYTVAGNTKATIGWTAVVGASSYNVKRSTVSGGPYQVVANVASNSYTDTNLVNDTPYYYVVSAVTGDGESSDSFQASVTPVYTPDPPSAPAGLQGTARDSQVNVTWNSVQGAESYNVLRSADGGANYTAIASGLTATSFTDGGWLTNGTTYAYAVQSKNVGGDSANSVPLQLTPASPFDRPSNLAAVPGNNKVSLSWDAVPGAVSYSVKRSTASGKSYAVIASNLASPTFTDASAVNGTAYFYVVSASNGQKESLNSEQVVAFPMNAPQGAPAIPSGVTGTAGDNEVGLTWSAVSGAVSYNVKRATSFTGPYTTLAGVTARQYADTSAVNGTRYYYAVTAVNASGESPFGTPIIATPAHSLIVAQDGTGDFSTIQAAVNAISASNTVRTVIFIKDGEYYEKVNVNKPNVSLVGESRDGTVITYDDYSCKPVSTSVVNNPTATSTSCAGLPAGTNVLGTSLSYTMAVSAANISTENVTIRNTSFPRSVVAPAVALYTTGDKAIFRNVKVLGFQDTVYANSGREYYEHVIIEGDDDYVFGNATALFDNSELKFVGNAGGHTTAASTDQVSSYGYVFRNSKLTRGTSAMKNVVTVGTWDSSWDTDANLAATGGSVDLGRPWRPYANVKYINTWMDAHIKAVGWDNWGSAANEATASYGEYNTSGPGANAKGRYKWSSQLIADEANAYTVQNVLQGADGWDPTLFGIVPQKPQQAKPAAPTGLTAALGSSGFQLTWNATAGAQSYAVYRSTSSGGPYTRVASGLTIAAYADTGITGETAYYYAVTATNELGESAFSNEFYASNAATFDRNVANQADISVTVKLAGDNVTDLANGNYQLIAAKDYTLDGTKYTIGKTYLAQLPIGTTTLTFLLANGGSIAYQIHVINTTALPGQVVANVPALHLYTIAGIAPYLPTLVPVNYTDQMTGARSVTWGSVSPQQYAAPGSFSLQGVLTGTSIPVSADITVQALSDVSAVSGGDDLAGYLTDLPFSMPSFSLYSYPNRDYNIQDYGAAGDGVTKNTTAFKNAIAAASSAGGGRVVVPAGVWLTGPIQLKSNINLHLEAGAKILFSPDYSDYMPGSTRYQSMLTGTGLTNVAITGSGAIDGNGQYWRYIKKSKTTASQWAYLLSLGGVLSADGSQWYPSQQAVDVGRPLMIDINNSSNVLIDGPTFMNSPQFASSITSCQFVVIRNTTVNNEWWMQNGDGLDVTSSQNVVMYHNTVNAGDDAIGMKSSNDPSPTNALSNVVIADNIVFRGHGGLSIGSNTSGGIKNMAVRNNQYIGTDNGLNFKSYVGGGGAVEYLYIDGIHMQNLLDTAINIGDFYKGHDAVLDKAQVGVDYRVPEFKNIHIRNVFVDGAVQAVYVEALPNVPVHDIDLQNVEIRAQKGWESDYMSNVQLTNVKITPASGAVYTLNHTAGFEMKNVYCPPGIPTFIHLVGSASGIVLRDTNYNAALTPFQLDPGISQSAITIVTPETAQRPNAPGNVSALAGNARVFVAWDAVPGADYYQVKRSTVSGNDYHTIASHVTGNTYLDTGLIANSYYYVVTAVGSGGESDNSGEAAAVVASNPAGMPLATLTERMSGDVGHNLTIHYGLSGLSGVSSAVYAQDLTFQYDPGLLQFVSATALVPGLSVATENNSAGKVRVLLASLGTGVSTDGDLIAITWKAIGFEQPGNTGTVIYLSKAISSDSLGTETTLSPALSALEITINKTALAGAIAAAGALQGGSYTPSSWALLQTYLAAANQINGDGAATQAQVDAAASNLQTAMELLGGLSTKAALVAIVTDAQATLAAASIGDRWGQYAQSTATALSAAIASAQTVVNNPNADQSAVNQAAQQLAAALQVFRQASNPKASIGDLAIISAHYGMMSGNASWSLYGRYDVNGDHVLDIVDLAAIARKMLTE
ncbi:pectinesterase family protein [Paenibacillus ferrarius]|uniref:pectinesterase family protein n=1 Tax=Paenibacillus ferrarius TaxID=1469647 RepID=UPI003D26FA5D